MSLISRQQISKGGLSIAENLSPCVMGLSESICWQLSLCIRNPINQGKKTAKKGSPQCLANGPTKSCGRFSLALESQLNALCSRSQADPDKGRVVSPSDNTPRNERGSPTLFSYQLIPN